MGSCKEQTDEYEGFLNDCENSYTNDDQNCLMLASEVILLFVVFAPISWLLYRSYINPEVYKKEMTEVGFDHIPSGPDRALKIARAQAARKLGSRIPPPYPNGWFALAESRELKTKGILPVDALGLNFCVYRGEDGVARCVDAYCPHLGANLAIGGSVCGSCIECPFHKWRYDFDGKLVHVPDIDILPNGVSIKTWTTAEADGAIWIWYDAEDRPPQWTIEDAPELKQYGYRGQNLYTISCHIQEIPENGADVAHLNAVHTTSLLTTLAEKYPILHNIIGHHEWSAYWMKNDDHTASIWLTHDYIAMNQNLFHVDVDVTQIGPGHVRLRLNSPLGPVLISQSVTPIGPLQQKVIHRVFSPTYNAPVGVIYNRAEAYQFERDVAIWNSKCYLRKPQFARSDKTIKSFRTWFSQFYSNSSISFQQAMTNPLDW